MLSHRRIQSSNVVQVLVVFALLLCVQPAFGQTRPVLSEVFQSRVIVQITTGTGADAETVEEAGEMTFNTPAGKAHELYTFEDGPSVEIFTRYDLGKIFTVTGGGCDVEDVTGAMPSFFGWVAQAKQGASDKVNGHTGTTWVGPSTDPVLVLLANNAGTVPLYYQETTLADGTTPQRTVKTIFLNWQPTIKQKPSVFDPPGNCLQ